MFPKLSVVDHNFHDIYIHVLSLFKKMIKRFAFNFIEVKTYAFLLLKALLHATKKYQLCS